MKKETKKQKTIRLGAVIAGIGAGLGVASTISWDYWQPAGSLVMIIGLLIWIYAYSKK